MCLSQLESHAQRFAHEFYLAFILNERKNNHSQSPKTVKHAQPQRKELVCLSVCVHVCHPSVLPLTDRDRDRQRRAEQTETETETETGRDRQRQRQRRRQTETERGRDKQADKQAYRQAGNGCHKHVFSELRGGPLAGLPKTVPKLGASPHVPSEGVPVAFTAALAAFVFRMTDTREGRGLEGDSLVANLVLLPLGVVKESKKPGTGSSTGNHLRFWWVFAIWPISCRISRGCFQ